MGEPLTMFLKRIDQGEGVTADEMSQLIWPLINVVKAASSLLAIVSEVSADDLNKRQGVEITALLVLRESIALLSKLEAIPTLDA